MSFTAAAAAYSSRTPSSSRCTANGKFGHANPSRVMRRCTNKSRSLASSKHSSRAAVELRACSSESSGERGLVGAAWVQG